MLRLWVTLTGPSRRDPPRSSLSASFTASQRCLQTPPVNEEEVQVLCCLHQLFLLLECCPALQPPVDSAEFTASAAPTARTRGSSEQPASLRPPSDDMMSQDNGSKGRDVVVVVVGGEEQRGVAKDNHTSASNL